MRKTVAIVAFPVLVAAIGWPAGTAELRKPFDADLNDIVDIRISDAGLEFIANLLADGLEQNALKTQVIDALEDQKFEILVPTFGGYADITVDFGETSAAPGLDGFRYDDVEFELSSVPTSTNLLPESGVLYPTLYLNEYVGSALPEKLPELHVRIIYPPFVSSTAPVSTVARARLQTSGVLRPFVGNGTLSFLIEQFDTLITEFQVDPIILGAGVPVTVAEALGEAIQEDFSKELEDALSDVLMSGLNDILFDRDQDAVADELLNLNDLFDQLNETLNTDFGFRMEPAFQSNATLPTTVLLRTNGSMFLRTPGDCLGPDVDDGFPYSPLELDGVAGHDPPRLVEVAPESGEKAQFTLSISDDFINQILHNGYRTGLACVFIDPTAPAVPSEVTSLMTTESLEIFTGSWLTDLFPDRAIGFRVRLLESPTAHLPTDDDMQIRAQLPGVQVDLMIEDEDRWVRLMGAAASMDLGMAVDDLSLSGDTLLELSFDFDLTNTVNYVELAPERKPELENLLPLAISLVEGSLSDVLQGVGDDVKECAVGLDVSLFEVGPAGLDPDNGRAHYLSIWLSVDGEVNLANLFECLLGEPLVIDGAPPVLLDSHLQTVAAIGARPYAAHELAGQPVDSWRFVPGFFHSGAQAVPAVPNGFRVWEWVDTDGNPHQIRLFGGAPSPDLELTWTADGLNVVVDYMAPIEPDLSVVTVLDGAGRAIYSGTGPILAVPEQLAVMAGSIAYSDSWGRRANVSVPAESSAGCRASENGTWLTGLCLVLLWIAAIRLRRELVGTG